MELKPLRIKSIEKIDNEYQCYDISVNKNHNFFIHDNILTHNCDYLTPNAQASLRNIIETFSKSARFIFTANYIEKLIQPIRSRCTLFEISTPPKAEILKRMMYILKQENVTFTNEDLASVIKENYPDQRAILNYLQDNCLTGELILSKQNQSVNDYCTEVVNLLMSKSDVKTIFNNIRQVIADSKVKQFADLYKYLFTQLDVYAKDGQKGLIILALADGQYKDSLVIDKEINTMATIVNIINILKQ